MRPSCFKKGADYGAEVPVLVPSSFPLRGTTFIDLHRERRLGEAKQLTSVTSFAVTGAENAEKTPRKAECPL
jgi:hypothetical protein